VQLTYADQSRTLDPEKSVYEVISEGMNDVQLDKVRVNARASCGRFTSRRCGWVARRGLQGRRPEPRVWGWRLGEAVANGSAVRPQLQRVRGVAEADAWRRGDAAAQDHAPEADEVDAASR
jgi:hypothetical protein